MELKFKKRCIFYECFGKDAEIMHMLFSYKINKGKVSFPIKYKNKIVNTLNRKKVNYEFINEDKKEFNVNTYDKLYDKANIMTDKEEKLNLIKNKIMNFNNKELDNFINYVGKYFNE